MKKRLKIIYIGPFYTNDWVTIDAMLPDIVLIDWQLRLLNYLVELDHTVYVKNHPESEIKMPDFFYRNIGVKKLEGVLEKVYKKADLIVMDYCGSSTFGFTLRTEKPLILVDFGFLKLRKTEDRKIRKRCFVIDGYFTRENKVDINWSDLNKGIENSFYLKDKTYSENVL